MNNNFMFFLIILLLIIFMSLYNCSKNIEEFSNLNYEQFLIFENFPKFKKIHLLGKKIKHMLKDEVNINIDNFKETYKRWYKNGKTLFTE